MSGLSTPNGVESPPSPTNTPAVHGAQVTRCGFLDMQVCVPVTWTDEQAEEFANRENPAAPPNSDSTLRWHARRQSTYDEALAEGKITAEQALARCSCTERAGFVHLILDC